MAAITALLTVFVAPVPGHTADNVSAPVWGGCPPAPGEPRDPRQQCATLRLPLDYRSPHGRKIDVVVSRIPTARPALRRGVLLTNPGGPGVSGLDWPSRLAPHLPAGVRERYDLIGFDPRGVGRSTPVTCGLRPDTAADLIHAVPAPDGSIARNVAFAEHTARDCAARSGDLLPFITTANTARDMDAIRAVLGEPRLSYHGLSYGSYLGAVYVSLFPQHTDRIILDSAVDPARVWYQQWRTWSLGFALRLPDFTGWAAARDATYHLGATPEAVHRTYVELTARLDRDPIKLPDGSVISGNLLRLVTFDALYSDLKFPTLAQTWQRLAAGGAPADLAARRLGRPGLGAALAVPADNLHAAQWAVLCGDVAWPREIDTYAHNVAVDRRLFPDTAGFPANLLPCAFWPHRPVEAPVKVTDRGPRNVLILQNLRDPATPWITGRGLRRALGQRAAMVSVDQGEHGVYPSPDNPCVDHIATGFLTGGMLPARDRLCPGRPLSTATPSPIPPLTPPGLLG